MSQLQRVLKFLFIPGLILAIAGIVARLITQVWSPLYIGLLVAGGVILLVWLIFIFSTAQGFWRKRSTQIGTNAIIATLALIAILGMVNFLAVRYSVRIDLSENQLFTLSPQTQELVRNLRQPLRVLLFDKEPNPSDRELLETYRRYNPNFTFEFVNPDVNPGLAEQLNVKSLGDVYLEYGSKRQLVQTLINFGQREPLSEIRLTNAIEKIKRDRTETIYFLQGHGEHPLNNTENGISQAVTSLEEKGYKVEALNLVERSTIPENASAIVIAGAKRKLFPQEVQLLQDYSDRGGSILLAIDPNINLGLDSLLKEWGIQLDDRIIIDASGRGNLLGYGPATPVITQYGDHPITRDFNSQEFTIYPLARSIGTVKVDGVTAVALMVTDEQMWAESDLESEQIQFDPTKDVPGPFDLGVAFTRSVSKTAKKAEEKATPQSFSTPISQPSPTPSPTPQSSPSPSPKTESRMVAIGNSTFVTNGWFEQQFNGDIFLNSVQWLASGDEQPLSIRAKEPKNRRITLTPLQAGTLGWMLIIVPLFGLIMAGITWWRRR
ncbi:MAG: Gldg family protein [Hydrococcus sp. Prado102]|jgi:ABC-type uncharacterized transport system involved in gliding motility auxiliary subunit|nr:Gldg family protein [Hydrococcus sp. Prado102]